MTAAEAKEMTRAARATVANSEEYINQTLAVITDAAQLGFEKCVVYNIPCSAAADVRIWLQDKGYTFEVDDYGDGNPVSFRVSWP